MKKDWKTGELVMLMTEERLSNVVNWFRGEQALGPMPGPSRNHYGRKRPENKQWLKLLSRFPEGLQREIIDERVGGTSEDVAELRNYVLNGKAPISVNISDILKYNLSTLERVPQEVVDIINHKWGTNAKTVTVFDSNPARYLEYSKMNPATTKPSVMFDGVIEWGVGRFIAALVRGDKTIKVWDLRTKKRS